MVVWSAPLSLFKGASKLVLGSPTGKGLILVCRKGRVARSVSIQPHMHVVRVGILFVGVVGHPYFFGKILKEVCG
jgi:hypothetical protein